MIELYWKKHQLFYKGKLFTEENIRVMEENPQAESITLTWDNIGDYFSSSHLFEGYITKDRKGYLTLWTNSIYSSTVSVPFKQKKEPNLDLVLKITYEKIEKVSFDFLFKWRDCQQAVQYIREHTGIEPQIIIKK